MRFLAGELAAIIEKFGAEKFTGTLTLNLELADATKQTKVLALWEGGLTFAGERLPSPREFVDLLKDKLQLPFIDASIKVAEKRIQNQDSIRELLDFLSRFNLFQWDKLEAMIQQELVIFFEPLLIAEGEVLAKSDTTYDLSYGINPHGLAWGDIQTELVKRQNIWQKLQPLGLESQLIKVENPNAEIPEEVVRHFNKWLDGSQSIGAIAAALKQDPLKIAINYDRWRKQNWIQFAKTANETTPLPTDQTSAKRYVVLSVDDSSIVQVSIKRAIGDLYTVICAKSAIEALNMLNAQHVDLMLLDVTMPDIDGLELCRTIRNIGRFKTLPIVMLTAKDGLIDKVKGQFVGSTHYLSKPVDREKLLPVLEKYIINETVAV
jgi:twitching motility two-component system response regulator PilG